MAEFALPDGAAFFLIRDSVACTIGMNARHKRILHRIVAFLLESNREMLRGTKRGRQFVGSG